MSNQFYYIIEIREVKRKRKISGPAGRMSQDPAPRADHAEAGCHHTVTPPLFIFIHIHPYSSKLVHLSLVLPYSTCFIVIDVAQAESVTIFPHFGDFFSFEEQDGTPIRNGVTHRRQTQRMTCADRGACLARVCTHGGTRIGLRLRRRRPAKTR